MAEKSKLVRRIVEFIIENIAILLTIGFAGYVIYRQQIAQMALSTDELLTAILTVLGLLAISEVVERYRRLNTIETLSRQTLQILENRLAERPSAIAFFQDSPNFTPYFQSATEIILCGVTLTTTLNRQLSNIRERLQAGANVRVLISDPDSMALEMSGARSESGQAQYYRHRLESSYQEIRYLEESLQRIQAEQGGVSKIGKFSVALLDYAPSFSITGFDTKQSNGILFVEIYSHKKGITGGRAPIFALNRQKDGEWYGFFSDQFERMWQAAKPLELKTTVKNQGEGKDKQ